MLPRPHVTRLARLAPLASLLLAAGAGAPVDRYRDDVEAWRRQREADLRGPDGWLALAGLTWLHPGANRFGSAPDNDIHLPASAPPHAGTLTVAGSDVTATLAPDVSATLNGKPLQERQARAPFPLPTDAAANGPGVLSLGPVSVQVIARGGRLAARVKDRESAARKHFAGLAWFPIAPEYRVVARLAADAGAAGRKLVVPDASGGKQELESPGTLAFTLQGRATQLMPVVDGPERDDLLIVFRDATSGTETYGGGRFVRARRQPDGAYVIDFNRAYSPPCAFTPYATCPLPPPANRLKVAVTAGEKVPPGAAHGAAGE
jgi:uncharacterized protein (DUF1684 family)